MGKRSLRSRALSVDEDDREKTQEMGKKNEQESNKRSKSIVEIDSKNSKNDQQKLTDLCSIDAEVSAKDCLTDNNIKCNENDRKITNDLLDSHVNNGPQKSSSIKVSTRVDYQPYLCKDYNETGYCGFGDNCIYVHDRGDYKSGWELEQEWEAKKNQKPSDTLTEKNEEIEQKDCLICSNELNNPVITSCGHLFCQECAIKRFLKDKSCINCGMKLDGQFKKHKIIN